MILSAPQNIFLNGLNSKYRAFVGGFGSGKTFVGCLDLLLFFAQHPGTRQGYFGPSYPSIRDVFYPTFEEAAHMLSFTVDIKESNKEVHLYRSGFYYGTVICRSMDRPGAIIGFKISRALVDEIDTLPKNKAEQAWNKIVARLRLSIPGVENGIGVTTTPEGFVFVYERFAREPTKSYSMVQASTYENQGNLPSDYIDSLLETYPAALVDAYVGGLFVNLTHGSVYRSFDRHENNSTVKVEPGDLLHIGMDFNRGKMAGCVFVERPDGYHCSAEIVKGLDTPWMINHIKDRWPDHKAIIYPDASGNATSSKSASLSDIGLLRAAGFDIAAKNTNPRIKDRVNSVNKGFETKEVHVNTKEAPETTRCLEQQPYDNNGEPDKTLDMDHPTDAFGYFVNYIKPIVKPVLVTGIRTAR
jgi:hypothetical protein